MVSMFVFSFRFLFLIFSIFKEMANDAIDEQRQNRFFTATTAKQNR